jgi:hypothetical protein
MPKKPRRRREMPAQSANDNKSGVKLALRNVLSVYRDG